MALIRCKECGHQVSDKAYFCPHCGVSVDENSTLVFRGAEEADTVACVKNDKKFFLWLGVVCLVLLLSTFTFVYLYNYDYDISTEQVVDLGLSVCWAGWNVGADSPEESGDYYAWGETFTKDDFSDSSYVYYLYSRYIDIGSDITATQYDVARSEWGDGWRMPTEAEFQELKDRCTWTWSSYKGENGYKITGPNGNCIFLPAAGCRYENERHSYDSNGYYWSATPSEDASYYVDNSSQASSLNFNSATYYVYNFRRVRGHTVRPVRDK